MKRVSVAIVLALVGTLAAACQPAPVVVPITATPPAAQPTPMPASGVTIFYEGYAQFEIIGATGQRILVDVYDPSLLTTPPTEDDFLLTTHTDGDHYNAAFVSSFPGPQIMAQVGSITAPDVAIQGIASAHGPNLPLLPSGGSNYIYVIDIAGLRIAHFGDIAQEELTQEQLDTLGEVDVAMLLFGGMCSSVEMNSFGLMEQVQPRLMIPTHAGEQALDHAFTIWDSTYGDPLGDSYADANGITIVPGDLTDEPHFLVLGEWATRYREAYDLSQWTSLGIASR